MYASTRVANSCCEMKVNMDASDAISVSRSIDRSTVCLHT